MSEAPGTRWKGRVRNRWLERCEIHSWVQISEDMKYGIGQLRKENRCWNVLVHKTGFFKNKIEL